MAELIVWAKSLWVVWLMLIFLGVVFWAYRPRNKRRFESDAQIPFREDQGEPRDNSEER